MTNGGGKTSQTKKTHPPAKPTDGETKEKHTTKNKSLRPPYASATVAA